MLQVDASQAISRNLGTQAAGGQTATVKVGLGPNAKTTTVNLRSFLGARGINTGGQANSEQINSLFSQMAASSNDFVTVTMTTTGPDGKPQEIRSTWGPPGTENVSAKAKSTATAGSTQVAETSTPVVDQGSKSVSQSTEARIFDAVERARIMPGRREETNGASAVVSRATTFSPVGGEVLTGIPAQVGGGKWTIPPEYQEALQHTFRSGTGVAKEMARAGYETAKDLAAAGWSRFTGIFSGPSFSARATATIVAMREHVQSGK